MSTYLLGILFFSTKAANHCWHLSDRVALLVMICGKKMALGTYELRRDRSIKFVLIYPQTLISWLVDLHRILSFPGIGGLRRNQVFSSPERTFLTSELHCRLSELTW